MIDFVEYQVIRPDGTVLLSQVAPFGVRAGFGREEPGFEIRGEMVTRWRILPDGEWTATARYPDGWASMPELIEQPTGGG